LALIHLKQEEEGMFVEWLIVIVICYYCLDSWWCVNTHIWFSM
jgi:hypothetical protein